MFKSVRFFPLNEVVVGNPGVFAPGNIFSKMKFLGYSIEFDASLVSTKSTKSTKEGFFLWAFRGIL